MWECLGTCPPPRHLPMETSNLPRSTDCGSLPPAVILALPSAWQTSAVWVLESGERGVRAGGKEETNCQGYAWEDDWCQAGLSCQPVRRQECLMFSLLVMLLCIFLCQRRRAIWTAKALQRPAGHLSSPWRSQCSASAECQWFVMTWELADRQVLCKEGEKRNPFCHTAKTSMFP